MIRAMLTEEGIRRLGGQRRPLLAGFLAGAVLAGVAVWSLETPRPGHRVPVLTVEGVTTAVNGDRSAIVIQTDEPVPGTFGSAPYQAGYGIADAQQIGSVVASEACLAANSSEQQVRLGVVNAAPSADGPGGAVVVWYECLGPARA
jgi:hypothetical protein